MIIVKAPFRISLFGGSTDYESFYKENGSFIIGTTINKYVYLSMRKRPTIFSSKSIITYSIFQEVNGWDEIHNPLIRETLKYKKVDVPIELFSFSDIPSRTGLGGSSTYAVAFLSLINRVMDVQQDRKDLVKDAIHIERVILNEAGGIQDQIWPAYPGLNSIEIEKSGNFVVKPLPVSEDFIKELQKSMLLIYTNSQRDQDAIAQSHEKKDKRVIMELARHSYARFLKEDIRGIGELLYETWLEKAKISNLISTANIDRMVADVMSLGAYGVKLLGSGGCGFLLVISSPPARQKIVEKYKDNLLDFAFDTDGVSKIYSV